MEIGHSSGGGVDYSWDTTRRLHFVQWEEEERTELKEILIYSQIPSQISLLLQKLLPGYFLSLSSPLTLHPKKRQQLRISGPIVNHRDERTAFIVGTETSLCLALKLNYCNKFELPPGPPLSAHMRQTRSWERPLTHIVRESCSCPLCPRRVCLFASQSESD